MGNKEKRDLDSNNFKVFLSSVIMHSMYFLFLKTLKTVELRPFSANTHDEKAGTGAQ